MKPAPLKSIASLALARYESVEHLLTSTEVLFEGSVVKVESRDTFLCKIRVFNHLMHVSVSNSEDSGERNPTKSSNGQNHQQREQTGSESIYLLPAMKLILDTDPATKRIAIHVKYSHSRFVFEANSAERFPDIVALWNALVHQCVLTLPPVRVPNHPESRKIEAKRFEPSKMSFLVDLMLDLKLTELGKSFPKIDYAFETTDSAGIMYQSVQNECRLDDALSDADSGLSFTDMALLLFQHMDSICRSGYLLVPLVFTDVYTMKKKHQHATEHKLVFQNLKNLVSCSTYNQSRIRVHVSNMVSLVISYIKTQTETETGPIEPRHQKLIDQLYEIHKKLISSDLSSFADVIKELGETASNSGFE